MNNKEQKGFWLASAIIFSSLIFTFTSSSSFAAAPAQKQNLTTAQPGDTSQKQKPAAKKVNETAKKQTTETAGTSKPTTKTNEQSGETTDQSVADNNDEVGNEIDESIETASYNKDPLEKFNRLMFTFNDYFDLYLMKPIAEVYNAIIPKPLNKGIHNFFNNLSEFPIIANDLLQFNFYQMTKDVSRLVVNSTMGIGGLFDMATRMHLPYFQNDFGLTLAAWGYKDSSYLVLPFFGSNTIRDGIIGMPVDYFGFSVYPYVEPPSRRFQLLALYTVDHRANLLQFEPVLEEAAIDKYVFMRNAYMQHRAFQMEQIKHLSYKDRDKDSSAQEVADNTEVVEASGTPEALEASGTPETETPKVQKAQKVTKVQTEQKVQTEPKAQTGLNAKKEPKAQKATVS